MYIEVFSSSTRICCATMAMDGLAFSLRRRLAQQTSFAVSFDKDEWQGELFIFNE